MDFPSISISEPVLNFLRKNKNLLSNYIDSNLLLRKTCGINDFFNSQTEADEVSVRVESCSLNRRNEVLRRQYGDYQTNCKLASQVTEHLFSKHGDFEFILEPTCGKGNFILASLKQWPGVKKIVGIEIYLPYVWETKFSVLSYFLENPKQRVPDIEIIHDSAFSFSYKDLSKQTTKRKTLVIGNPPWVTNSELGSISSDNLPPKSNFKRLPGLDAITGKSNFDISEYITLTLLECFHNHNGAIAVLIKNSTARSILREQRNNPCNVGRWGKYNINAQMEFNAAVDACLLIGKLNDKPGYTCTDNDFYLHTNNGEFGWYNGKFVSSIGDYSKLSEFDGESQLIWRSGIKHDCSRVMELDRINGGYKNGLGENVDIESDLVYALLKSSDLQREQAIIGRKFAIVTQKKVGQETKYIEKCLPLTYAYLHSHRVLLEGRKSSIYRGKPAYSIFGIGEYSFAKYKVCISGLYKSTHFTVVGEFLSRPVMLDDTCYFIGFEEEMMAKIACFLLNSQGPQKFLKSIIFQDAKRPITKDILMRIDLEAVFESVAFEQAQKRIKNLTLAHWERFSQCLKTPSNLEMTLF